MTELRRLAEAATPGPWTSGGLPIGDGPLPQAAYVFGPDGDSFVDVQWNPGRNNDQYADAAYIAAANPKAILELLDERDRLREALDKGLDLVERSLAEPDDGGLYDWLSENAATFVDAARAALEDQP